MGTNLEKKYFIILNKLDKRLIICKNKLRKIVCFYYIFTKKFKLQQKLFFWCKF